MTKNEALQILGLGRKFTQDEAKSNYRKLARKYHPDIAGEQFNTKFAQINEAYNFISNLGEEADCILTHINIFDVGRS